MSLGGVRPRRPSRILGRPSAQDGTEPALAFRSRSICHEKHGRRDLGRCQRDGRIDATRPPGWEQRTENADGDEDEREVKNVSGSVGDSPNSIVATSRPEP